MQKVNQNGDIKEGDHHENSQKKCTYCLIQTKQKLSQWYEAIKYKIQRRFQNQYYKQEDKQQEMTINKNGQPKQNEIHMNIQDLTVNLEENFVVEEEKDKNQDNNGSHISNKMRSMSSISDQTEIETEHGI